MAMFTHITLGTSDLKKGQAFYDAVLGPLGYKRLFTIEDRCGYGAQAPELLIVKPYDGKAASGGNGTTVGLAAPNRAAVSEFHKQGLANGGKCEGPPGPRAAAPNLYAAYLRDPWGNKVAAVCMAPE
jgi:catechol 2,3-dioxygenase-like lactoylglutathione lyase family enzyme